MTTPFYAANDYVQDNTTIPETVQLLKSDSDNDSNYPCKTGVSCSSITDFSDMSLCFWQSNCRGTKRAKPSDHFDRTCILSMILQNKILKRHECSTTFILLDQPLESIRPGYECDGTRGTLTARNGKHLQLQIMIQLKGFNAAMVVVSLANEDRECARDFQLSLTERHHNYCETSNGKERYIIHFMSADVEQLLNLQNINIERKSTKRMKKLEKTCRLHFRLIVAENFADLVEIAELYSDRFSIEQPSGPPKIDRLIQLDNSHLFSVEGKNFKKESTKIYFDGEEAVILTMNKEMVICSIPERFRYQTPGRMIYVCVQVDNRKSEPKGIKVNPQNTLKQADIYQANAHQFAGSNTLPANFCPDLVRSAPEYVNERYDNQLWQDYGAGNLFIQESINCQMDWNPGSNYTSTNLSQSFDSFDNFGD